VIDLGAWFHRFFLKRASFRGNGGDGGFGRAGLRRELVELGVVGVERGEGEREIEPGQASGESGGLGSRDDCYASTEIYVSGGNVENSLDGDMMILLGGF
jgi:hypothetical protein